MKMTELNRSNKWVAPIDLNKPLETTELQLSKSWKLLNQFNELLTNAFNSSVAYMSWDMSKISELMGSFHLMWWENVANNIDVYSLSVTKSEYDFARLTHNNVRFQLSERQRRKSIKHLLWYMLLYHVRQINAPVWPFDPEIVIKDLVDCVNRFGVDEELFREAIELAKEQYVDQWNEKFPLEDHELKWELIKSLEGVQY